MFTAKIKVYLRPSILDPQGKTIEHALRSLGFDSVIDSRIGKYIELKINAASETEARDTARLACEKLLANPVMDEFDFEIVQTQKENSQIENASS
jgi:phosphoribosylformylglycinamidine synthase